MWSETSKKDRILTNTLVVAITELVLMLGGMKVMSLIIREIIIKLNLGTDIKGEFLTEMIGLGGFLIPIGFCLLYMLLTKPATLRVFCKGNFSKRLLSLLIGMVIGFCINGVISLLTGLTGSVTITFQGLTPYMILILPFCFIQCTCEEVMLRGYVPQYMDSRHDWSSVAFVSGGLFIFHHHGNLDSFGFSSVFCINVFLIGVMLYLLIRVNGNFWICCGFHTAWNFTQQYLFGLPNSGMTSSYALFQGTDSKDTFFYNTIYGNEGSWITTVVIVVMILVLLYLGGRAAKKKK